jgi:anti-sigma-K factor RskA
MSGALSEAELAELRDLLERGGGPAGDVHWERPPDELWDRIAAATDQRPAAVPVSMAARRRTWWLGLAAAAAAIVVIVALVVGGGGGGKEVVAAVELDRLGEAGSGRAELVERDGALELRVETDDLDAGDGFLELWLIDPTVSKLVSLGPLRPDGVYEVPAGVDPALFPIVDVSVEPVDGDPTHSGQSVLRGELSF